MRNFQTLTISILLSSVLMLPPFTNPKKEYSIVVVGCNSDKELSFDQIPSYKAGQIVGKTGFSDGRYYEQTISFNDNITGLLFQGGNSQRYFIEDPSGTNYYYKDKDAAIRALYIYKRYGCTSTYYC